MKKRDLMNRLAGLRSLKKIAHVFLLLVWTVIFSIPAFSVVQQRKVLAIKVSGPISPVSSEFIGKSIRKAGEMNAEALVV